MRNLPETFSQFMIEIYGTRGAAWVAELPQLVAACAARWHLHVHDPFPVLSYNFAAPATDENGRFLVLKIGIPNKELLTEIAALRCYDGHGICQLYAADPQWGALLIERLRPGTMLLAEEDDAAATAVAAQVMQQVWRPLTAEQAAPFPTVHAWANGLSKLRATFAGGVGPFPPKLVETAESLFRDLLASMDKPLLLHGDLHHYNILQAAQTARPVPQPWLAIDPKGVIGEPAYEVGAFMRNPLDLAQWPDLRRVLARRAAIFAEQLGLERQRIIGWSLAQAVLSAWWSYEDSKQMAHNTLTIAQALAELLP
ncbi:MAG: hypothetical protein KC443_07270 [Anaerolineales bacterium]|nr:hypothetical protein [Anaerolineales bacterium]